jgi:hypothetical protein
MKKQIILITFLVSLTFAVYSQSSYTDIPQSKKTIAFADEFSTNQNNWIISKTPEYRGKIKGGYYYWQSFVGGGAPIKTLIGISIDQEKDYEIETYYKWAKGETNSGNFFWWGSQDATNRQCFGFSKDPLTYRIFRQYLGDRTEWVSWTESYYINPADFNKLTIRKVDDKIYFFINEKHVHTQDYEAFIGNNFGFSVSEKTTIAIDYLRVYYLN